MKVWDADKGQEILTLKGHTGFVASVAFSADGKRIVSGELGQDGEGVGRGHGPGAPPLKGHTDSVISVAFSADGKRIVSGRARDRESPVR